MLQPSSRTATRLLRQPFCRDCAQRIQLLHSSSRLSRSLSTRAHTLPQAPRLRPHTASLRAFSSTPGPRASPPSADALIEQLTDLYGTARDEFEIAAEETEKKTVYAADDRDAAREAFGELKTKYEEALRVAGGDVGRDVKERVGTRIRELENALTALEESAMED
jgi:hypothetical protein